MWVVKLGGSLDGAGYLKEWVTTLASAHVPLVIVPGGGGFADEVRDAQKRWGIDDATAHRMAILAMEQTAHLICGMSPQLVPATGTAETSGRQSDARVWFPRAELLGDTEIPHGWGVTSDSLAAVLSGRIRAAGLALVKSAPLGGRSPEIRKLQDDGILDTAFASFGEACGCPVWLLEGQYPDGFGRLASGRANDALRVRF